MIGHEAQSGIIDTSWLSESAEFVANLGFSIVTGTHAGNPVATDLVIALRDQPTLRHFDPEEVSYWVARDGRGRPAHVTRETHAPFEARFLWGRISIADRLGMTNQWLSFGGGVRAAELDPSTLIVSFNSPAPIQRWSGHSQGLDPLTPEMGAFFGRLMIPIDFEPGAEPRVSSSTPLVLYCAFVRDLEGRLRRSAQLRQADRSTASFVAREAHRLEATEPAGWTAGAQLLGELGVGPPP